MRGFTLSLIAFVLLVGGRVYAQAPEPQASVTTPPVAASSATPAVAAPSPTPPKRQAPRSKPRAVRPSPKTGPELRIVGHDGGTSPADFRFELDDTLVLELSGKLAKAIRREYAKPLVEQNVQLNLAGIPMKALKVDRIASPRAGTVRLQFRLGRESNDDDSRQAWNELFQRASSYAMQLPVSLSIGKNWPVGAVGPETIQFQVASPLRIRVVIWSALLLFVVIFTLLVRLPQTTRVLRDTESGMFSLGKTQMAFWGLLVFGTVVAILAITGGLERIPTQTLTLLGISGATGLGAAVINRAKKAQDDEQVKKLSAEEQTIVVEQQKGVLPPSVALRLDALRSDLARLQKPSARSKSFLTDICDDGHGASFHRVQVVVWTVLLGFVFVRTVAQTVSMPEFPETLLLLMGISNGTYLGFKLPE